MISKPAHPERVVSFVEWIHESQENYDLIRYGVKDRNYTAGDRVTFPRSVRPLSTWFAAEYFIDIRYERLTPNLDANFREFYKDAGFKNTVTTRQLYGNYEEKAEENSETLEDMMREYDQIEKLIEVYFANMEKFISATNEGNLSMPPDELTKTEGSRG